MTAHCLVFSSLLCVLCIKNEIQWNLRIMATLGELHCGGYMERFIVLLAQNLKFNTRYVYIESTKLLSALCN